MTADPTGQDLTTALPAGPWDRYRDLQRYVGWTETDQANVAAAGSLLEKHFAALVNDFYAQLQQHAAARRVITGGPAQIERLKQSLLNWLRDLFAGNYDEAYVLRRWRVGLKHVAIGLPQIYAAAALSRLRMGIAAALAAHWTADARQLQAVLVSLHKLIDLDLAIMSDAYETEHVQRQTDVERRRLSDVLHREKELSAGLLAHAQAAVLILDRTGRIVRCNSFAENLLTSSRDRGIADQDWFSLFLKEEDQARLRSALLDPMQGTADGRVQATSLLEQDGGTRQLHWSAVPLLDGAGEAFAVLVVGHDITELFQAQQRALQAERLAAIGEMATGLAHESRNALQRIGANAEMLELELEGNATAAGYLQRIQQAKEHLHQLLEEVRSYAAPIVLDRSPIRISEAWREAWQLLSPQRRGRDCQLREHISAADLTADVDRFRIVQVFRNLLDNALAATQDPVELDIWCEASRLGDQPALRVRVRDNGPGLTAQQRQRIFEPFYTTKPTGTGLGTSIAQRLITAHGGSIRVSDQEGSGTEITVEIPKRGAAGSS